MQIRRGTLASKGVRGPLTALCAPLFGVVVMLAGLGFILVPSTPAAAAAPPAQGWTTTQAPLPTDAGNGSTNPNVYLASSACPAANNCTMVGWYYDTSDWAWGLIEQQSGTNWTQTEAPEPADHGTGSNQGLWIGSHACGYDQPCRALSCPTPTFCIAVGDYYDTGKHYQPVVETESQRDVDSGHRSAPVGRGDRFGADLPRRPPLLGELHVDDVVRRRGPISHHQRPVRGPHRDALRYHLERHRGAATGGCHTDQHRVPARGDRCLVHQRHDLHGRGDLLRRVGEDARIARNAVERQLDSGDRAEPGDAGTGSLQSALLSQVDCPTASACTAVGFYRNTAGNSAGLIESWNGTTWAATTAPAPPGI